MGLSHVKPNVPYEYKRYKSSYETWRYINVEEDNGQEHLIAELRLGCVSIKAVAFSNGKDYATCYDVFVKDKPEAKEYIFYGTVYEKVEYTSSHLEKIMLRKLLRYLEEHKLSYIECKFRRKPGSKIKNR